MKILLFYTLHFPNKIWYCHLKTNLEKDFKLTIPLVQLLNFKKMKTLYLWGACALLSTTLFSCSADELESSEQKTEIKKEIPTEGQASEPDGPGDDQTNITPPKK